MTCKIEKVGFSCKIDRKFRRSDVNALTLFCKPFFVGSLTTSLFPLYFFPSSFPLSESQWFFISLSLVLSQWLFINLSFSFLFWVSTNSLSIFKSSSCHQFLFSIYTSACLDLGVSKQLLIFAHCPHSSIILYLVTIISLFATLLLDIWDNQYKIFIWFVN